MKQALDALVVIVLILALMVVAKPLTAQKGKSESSTSQEVSGVPNAETCKANRFDGCSHTVSIVA